MPFGHEFDDVYTHIKQAFGDAITTSDAYCFRLDEIRPAGRITERLYQELQTATLCIADLTDNNPNVMWEVGFIMALNKPVILLTQNKSKLPFDIVDMQCITYERNQLTTTLSIPLKRIIIDTTKEIAQREPTKDSSHTENIYKLVGQLLSETNELRKVIDQLREIILETVRAWKPINNPLSESTIAELKELEGCWINTENGTHLYAKVINDELVVPYCYAGNNKLDSFYFGWKKSGEYWFSNFKWFDVPVSGFTFLKHESKDVLVGNWWSIDTEDDHPIALEMPPTRPGNPSRWKRVYDTPTPSWALDFFRRVSKGVVVVTRSDSYPI